MTASNVLPVTLLTGFLGSGKTTLLNRLLTHPAMPETAVLINEFGAIPIDHLLVRESSENLMVLSNGCVCCSVAGDMVQALRELYFKRASGEIPAFTRVVIETTGLADPAPILHTLLEMPLVAARYAFSGVVTTIDAEHGASQLETHWESVKQLALADRIILTKVDRVSTDAIAAVKERIQAINPHAHIIESCMGAVEPDQLLNTGLVGRVNAGIDIARWMGETHFPHRDVSLFAANTEGEALRGRRAHRVQTFSIRYEAPVVWDRFVEGIEALLELRGPQILRAKGIVTVVGDDAPRAIHIVQHTIYPMVRLPGVTLNDTASQLVFIVQDLTERDVRAVLESFIA